MIAKRIFTNWRILLLFIMLLLAIVAIGPRFDTEGVAIRQVERNSSAHIAGLQNPGADLSPTERERIIAVNGQEIDDVAQYYALIQGYPPNRTLTITTNLNTYRLTTQPQENGTGSRDVGISVYPAPRNNLKLGLDLSGGTRVILRPVERVSQEDLEITIENIQQRLNVYGLSDITVRSAKDLSGDDFIIVEIAGADRSEVENLLAQQGKFEAQIGNQTVFSGGEDITSVCRSAECSGIRGVENQACGQTVEGGWVCPFYFQITLSPEAAERQASMTRNLQVRVDQGGSYLSEPLRFYLDNELVNELRIAADLQGRAATTIAISGSGSGTTEQAAAQDAITNMRQMQTVLETGSLPVQLEIVKSDGISPALGGEFVKNAILIGLLSTLAVATVLVIRYRNWLISIPIIITMLSESILVLGFAAIVGWNLDLASIAAIVIAIGSGVDDQIVIIDETLRGGVSRDVSRSWRDKIKTAFFIVFASYFTLAFAMVPLLFAGAGLLRGFAITTLVGFTVGVLITRPAFAALVEMLLAKEEQ